MSDAETAARGVTGLLGPAQIRALADELDLRPTKQLGQNFVHDANTVRRIVAAAHVGLSDTVLEIGPGLGSLTLGLLDVVGAVVAVEVDPLLADRLPRTVRERAPQVAERLTVVYRDALRIRPVDVPMVPTALVANLPYNVAVPVLLQVLAEFPTVRTALVMVQAEVADRLAARPGSRVYGAPSAKVGFFGAVRRAGAVGRQVFWPVPQVESGLVGFERFTEPPWSLSEEHRQEVFAVIDAAFAQRRKTLRGALAGWAGSSAAAEKALRAADIDPGARGETLATEAFVRLAAERPGRQSTSS